MSVYARLAMLALVLAAFGGTFWVGGAYKEAQLIAAIQDDTIKAVAKARLEEQTKQKEINNVLQTQFNELSTINNQLTTDLGRLHNRPDRRHVPKGTKSRCQGASGAELSRRDASFLTRLAQRAERQRTALKTCYKYADTVTSK